MQSQNETPSSVRLHQSWLRRVGPEFQGSQMKELKDFLAERKVKGAKIFPRGSLIFNALDRTPFERVKVVILGQDPYHGPGQAHGLSFSVPRGVAPPPSLQNIFKELEADLGVPRSTHGCLETWADQGVLLLNAVLTVEEGKAGSHQNRGWEPFTDAIIRALNDERQHLVFLLWGAFAQRKAAFVDRKRHLVLESPHPSPLSAHRGFLGSRPFSKINSYLQEHGIAPVNWALPP